MAETPIIYVPNPPQSSTKNAPDNNQVDSVRGTIHAPYDSAARGPITAKPENKASETTTGTPAEEKKHTKEQEISRKRVRILIYGGARSKNDNSAFKFASLNVIADYKQLFPKDVIIHKFTDSAKEIVDTVNEQEKGSIASLDLFSHGSKWALYFYKGASLDTNLSKEDVSEKKLNAGLYGNRVTELSATDEHNEKRLVSDINFDRFAEGAVIELHGCESGGKLLIINGIINTLSKGIPTGYAIGHTTKITPMINGPKTKVVDQDYWYGSRAIWQNSKELAKTTQEGHINVSDHIK